VAALSDRQSPYASNPDRRDRSAAGNCGVGQRRDDLPLPARHPDHRTRERLTTEVVDHLQQLAAAGVMVEGAVDESLAQFRVVA
jgi:hypothetical protein